MINKILKKIMAIKIIAILTLSSGFMPNAFALEEYYITDSCSNFYECYWWQNFASDVKRDFYLYFQTENILYFGNFFIAAAILANTGLDKSIRNAWQEDVRSSGSDKFFKGPKAIGGLSYYYFPIYLGVMGLGYWRQDDLLGNVAYNWGYRSLRTVILGGLQQLILTHALGSGRPIENQPSKWQPFRYNTGVSGHAFYGAVPFITAAMMTDPPVLKGLLYIASTLPGISRINSDAHYTSQVLLGWALAYFSARAVYLSDQKRIPTFQFSICPRSDGAMVAAGWRF